MTYDSYGDMLTVDGPLAGTADTTRFRYNAAREVIGVIGPDPDAAGSLKHRAVRNTYDGGGHVTKVEKGTVNSQSDPDWNNFAPLETVDIAYDSNWRVKTRKLSGGGTAYALTQSSYDALGRPECSAVRMNTAIYGSLPASACTLGTQGSFGPDRIAKTIYDAAGQVTQAKVAFGTSDEANERTLTYSNNGRLATLTDAETNKTTYEYDGHDRLSKTRLPDTTKGSGTSSTTDYEQLTYDAASNVTNRRLRDATSIAFTYDNLNRVTLKNLPGSEPDVTYGYDSFNRLTSASQTGNSLSFSYDALGRNLTQVGPQGTVTSEWDLAGRRTKLTYPGSGLYVDYDYLLTDDMTKIRENGATSGVGVLATYDYDNLGRRTSLTRGNGTVTSYTYDAVSRLATLAENMTGTSNDQSVTFNYSPASQITSLTKTNDAYAWTGHGNGSTASVANGLNQLTSIGGTSTTHDARGNLTTDPTSGKTFTYSSENLLTGASGGVALAYDPSLRLYQVTGAATTRLAYDGTDMIAEYDGSNALLRRYVHGPSVDEPIVTYEGTGTTNRSWLHADERGSVIALSDGSGNVTSINNYDEFGRPQGTNVGRFQYTGQQWLSELGAYYYKARIYSPTFGGRFYQTDPIGYSGGANVYAYVGNDPINLNDPTGLYCSYWAEQHGGCTQEGDARKQLAGIGIDSAKMGDEEVLNFLGDLVEYLESIDRDTVNPSDRLYYQSSPNYSSFAIVPASLDQTRIGNTPTDAEGYRLVGETQVSLGIFNSGKTFGLFPNETRIKVTTFSHNASQAENNIIRFRVPNKYGAASPVGVVHLRFAGCEKCNYRRGLDVPVLYNVEFTRYYRIPLGIGAVSVIPVSNTPRATSVTIRAKGF